MPFKTINVPSFFAGVATVLAILVVGFGGGVMIPFGKSLGSLNLGARYHYGARATYLREGDIIDNPDGSVTLNVRSSKTDLVLWQIGFTYNIP